MMYKLLLQSVGQSRKDFVHLSKCRQDILKTTCTHGTVYLFEEHPTASSVGLLLQCGDLLPNMCSHTMWWHQQIFRWSFVGILHQWCPSASLSTFKCYFFFKDKTCLVDWSLIPTGKDGLPTIIFQGLFLLNFSGVSDLHRSHSPPWRPSRWIFPTKLPRFCVAFAATACALQVLLSNHDIGVGKLRELAHALVGLMLGGLKIFRISPSKVWI